MDAGDQKSLELLNSYYLSRVGWTQSMAAGRAINSKGEPIPWITYATLKFLLPRMRDDLTVFEYGSGNSTLWWASRVKRVVSVEHHEPWYRAMASTIPANCEYLLRPLEENVYPQEILSHPSVFDVAFIDGRKRVRSAIAASQRLSDRGVIIWDNSERKYYQPGYDHLQEKGFRRIDFHGLGPARPGPWYTSIFYRDGNWPGI